MSNKRLLVDFDRVIHRYSKGWHDGTIYDKPVDGAVEALKSLQAQGWQIIIFTTRSKDGDFRNALISRWLFQYGIQVQILSWIPDIKKLVTYIESPQ